MRQKFRLTLEVKRSQGGFFEWGFDQGELWLTKRSH
jgi:hypothetical protein